MIISIISLQSFAALSPKIKIHGKIKSFNENYVLLEQDKKKVKLPRNVFPDKIFPDQDITVEINKDVSNSPSSN